MAVTIISVYPSKMKAERQWGPKRGAGFHTYQIEAAQGQAGYSKLVVEDAFQKTYYGEDVGYRFDLIPAQNVALDVVNEWTNNMVGLTSGYGPGIGVIKGADPTRQELDALMERQGLYFEYLFEQAEALYKAGHHDQITEDMRRAAKWMGRENALWLKPFKQQVMKQCPFCISDIPVQATVCQVCHRDLPQAQESKAGIKAGK